MDLVPNELNNIGNLVAFKKASKKWSPERYPSRLCKVYISSVCFIKKKKKEIDVEFFPFKNCYSE